MYSSESNILNRLRFFLLTFSPSAVVTGELRLQFQLFEPIMEKSVKDYTDRKNMVETCTHESAFALSSRCEFELEDRQIF